MHMEDNLAILSVYGEDAIDTVNKVIGYLKLSSNCENYKRQ